MDTEVHVRVKTEEIVRSDLCQDARFSFIVINARSKDVSSEG